MKMLLNADQSVYIIMIIIITLIHSSSVREKNRPAAVTAFNRGEKWVEHWAEKKHKKENKDNEIVLSL